MRKIHKHKHFISKKSSSYPEFLQAESYVCVNTYLIAIKFLRH